MYRWTHLQSRDRDTDKENKCVDDKGGWGTRMNREVGIDIYTLLILRIKQTTNENLLNALWWPEWEGNPKKEETYVYIELIHVAVQ